MNKNKLALLLVVGLSSLSFGLNAAEGESEAETFRSEYLTHPEGESFMVEWCSFEDYRSKKAALGKTLYDNIALLTVGWGDSDWSKFLERDIGFDLEIEAAYRGLYPKMSYIDHLARGRAPRLRGYPKTDDAKYKSSEGSKGGIFHPQYIKDQYEFHEKCLQELHNMIDWIKVYNGGELRKALGEYAALQEQFNAFKGEHETCFSAKEHKKEHPEVNSSNEEKEEESYIEARVDAQPSRVGRDIVIGVAGVTAGVGALYVSQNPEVLTRAAIRARAKAGELANRAGVVVSGSLENGCRIL